MKKLLILALFAGLTQTIKSQTQDGMYAKIKTNKGEILIQLEFEKTPLTVANFVGLAQGKIENNAKAKGAPFYDGLKFHRVIANFMIQGGCPNGTGSGSPGYKFPDEFHPDLKHSGPGILSMANSGTNTNGSQFFITHKATPNLDNRHSVFGKVVEGMEVVDIIANVEKDARDKPKEDIVMESVTIIRKGSTAKNFDAAKTFNAALEKIKKEEAEKAAESAKEMKKLTEGATVTASGLAYKVINKGSGKVHPNPQDSVIINCTGKLIDGTIFWSTEEGKPLAHPANGFVPGFSEGIQLMVVGDKWRFIIPSNLAYGEKGMPQAGIGPNTTLIFEVELLEIK